jgi:hypothetical protein
MMMDLTSMSHLRMMMMVVLLLLLRQSMRKRRRRISVRLALVRGQRESSTHIWLLVAVLVIRATGKGSGDQCFPRQPDPMIRRSDMRLSRQETPTIRRSDMRLSRQENP